MFPFAIALSAAAAVLLLASNNAQANQQKIVERKLTAVMPSRKRRDNSPVVPFTTRSVFWRLNPKTKEPEYRIEVIEEPEVLAQAASEKLGREIPLDVFTLATLMASEAGSGPELAQVAIAHAALTAAAKGKRSLHTQVTSPYPLYSSQHGHYAATSHAPTLKHIELAEAVYSGQIANPVPGADQWDSPRAQKALIAQREPGYSARNTPKAVAKKRTKAGKEAVYLKGVDPEYLRLWRSIA